MTDRLPERAADRVAAVLAAVPKIDPAVPLEVHVPSGTVAFTLIRGGSGDGQKWIEANVAGPAGGDPAFRVVNPPALVPDPAGEVEISGVRYRNDPLAALAEVIAGNGGASTTVRKGRWL